MTRLLLMFICCIGTSSLSIASYYAVAPCEGETQQNILDKCAEHQIKVVTTTQNSGFVIIDLSSKEKLSTFCYYAEVRQIDKHIAFNTNTLLVKATNLSSSIITAHKLKAHSIVPNLYYSRPEVNNDVELSEYKTLLQKQEGIEYVSYNQVFTLNVNVNDPLYPRQWGLENTGTAIQYNGTPGADMSVDLAWTISTGDVNVKIAILDSGVDTLQEDLVNNMLPGFDGFGLPGSDTQGYPTPNFNGDGHGTSCAGIVAAEGDNNLGIAGIAYTSKIIPIRIFYYVDYGPGIGIQGTTTTDGMLSGTAYAWRIADADLCSTSAGLNDIFIQALGIDTLLINTEINDAFMEGRNGKGVSMFFSSGNDDNTDVLWPANMPTTIAVGASSMCDERKSPADCSGENWGGNYGETLDLVAPGVKVATTDMTGSNGFSASDYFYTFNGTSAACPNAAGVAALIISVNGTLHAADVRAILNITADRVPNYTYDSTSIYGTWNTEMGHGRVNGFAAVQLAQTYQSTAEINENSDNFEIMAFPNPTNGNVSINFGAALANWEVKIVDIQGKEVLNEKVETSGTANFEFDGAPGIYVLSVQSNTHHSLLKLVKE
jgi:subtilisin family serine protease